MVFLPLLSISYVLVTAPVTKRPSLVLNRGIKRTRMERKGNGRDAKCSKDARVVDADMEPEATAGIEGRQRSKAISGN